MKMFNFDSEVRVLVTKLSYRCAYCGDISFTPSIMCSVCGEEGAVQPLCNEISQLRTVNMQAAE